MLLRRTLIFVLSAVLIAMPVLAQQQMDEFMQGKLDGARDARGNPAWVLAGLGCGLIGVGVAYVVTPSPPARVLMGKPSGYILGYTEGYKNKARNRNVTYACIGWAVWVALYLGVILPAAD